jgi:hypothetical protein
MKKLYFLDEEEKNRILNLHESATKRQYLSEQTTTTSSDDIQKTMKDLGVDQQVINQVNSIPNLTAGGKRIDQTLQDLGISQDIANKIKSSLNTPAGTTTTAPAGTTTTAPAGTTTTAPAGTTTTAPAGTTTTAPAGTTTTTPASTTWSPDPTGNKTWEYQFKDGKWFARKIGQTREYDISSNEKYASSVKKLNDKYPEAIKPVTTTNTNTTPVNTVVGDPNSEAIKKTAEANASTNVVANNNTNNNTQQQSGGTNFTEVDGSEFS